MTADKAAPPSFWAEVERSFAAKQWAALDALLLPRIAAATTSKALWKLLGTEPLAEGLFGDDELGPALLEAVLAKAPKLKPAEHGGALALVVRASARDPLNLVMKDESNTLDYDAKPGSLEVLERNESLWLEALSARSAAVRAPAFLALGHLRRAAPETVQTAMAAAKVETDAAALAASLLALAALHVRGLGVDREELRVFALRHSGSPEPWVAVCAAAALALAGDRMDGPALLALCEAIRAPVPAPAALGMSWEDERETSAGVAARVLVWADVAEPSVVIDALTSLAEYAEQGAAILLRFAFDGGDLLPGCGITLAELTPQQRAAVGALRAPAFSKSFPLFQRLGLGVQADVQRFLDAREPFFRPLPTLAGRPHLGRAWAEHGVGSESGGSIVAAVRDAMTLDEAVTAWCIRRRNHLVRTGTPRPKDVAQRLAELPVAYAQAVDQAALRAALLHAKPNELDAPMFALLALTAFGASLPAELESAVTQGLRLKAIDEPLTSLVSALPPDLRAKLSGG